MPDRGRWIVIPGWDVFQHRDAGRSGRGLTWIRDYADQLAKDEFRDLTFHQRGLLRDLRLSYATTRGQLRDSTAALTRRLGHRVMTRDLDALAHAGFIAFSASKPPALGQQAASLEVEVEVEVENLKAVSPTKDPDADPSANGNGPRFEIPNNLLKGVDDER